MHFDLFNSTLDEQKEKYYSKTMNGIFSWIKTHKLIIFFALVILYLLLKNSSYRYSGTAQMDTLQNIPNAPLLEKSRAIGGAALPQSGGGVSEVSPVADVKNRLVIKNTDLSLLVDKVADVQKKIIQKAEALGGYMVSSNLENPQDVASATVIVRVPAKQMETALTYYRSLSVKVISENLQGTDVTDQYTDLDAQLKTYTTTKQKFEEMLNKAITVQDILDVQREIINVQYQIDSVKGQQDYLKKNAEMSKITIYLSTDELALPYAPTETWRPSVIFKQAIRSVVGTLRSVGTLIIWLAVYAVFWVPVLLIILFIRRRRQAAKM